MIDIYNHIISPKKISFSGTVNFVSPSKKIFKLLCDTYNNINLYFSQIYEFKKDDNVGPAIEASVYGITTIKPEIINYKINFKNKKDDYIENNLIDFLFDKRNILNFQALIDSGGLILNTKVEKMVDLIQKILLKNNKDNKDYYILYINSKHERMVRNIYEKPDYNYNNEVYENLFIYYDN
jgi:hypothetical protein